MVLGSGDGTVFQERRLRVRTAGFRMGAIKSHVCLMQMKVPLERCFFVTFSFRLGVRGERFETSLHKAICGENGPILVDPPLPIGVGLLNNSKLE